VIVLLAFLAVAAADEVKFEPASERFANAAGCRTHLEGIVSATTGKGYDAARGPYAIADGDIRVHMVKAEGNGHRIWEHRCLAEALSSRTWHHSMEADAEEFTVESVARTAEWLKKEAPKQ